MVIPIGVVLFGVFLMVIHACAAKPSKESEHVRRNKERCISEAMKLPWPESANKIAELKKGWGETA